MLNKNRKIVFKNKDNGINYKVNHNSKPTMMALHIKELARKDTNLITV